MGTKNEKQVRRGLLLTGMGLAIEVGAQFYWTPMTFVVAASVGVPLVLLGAWMFMQAAWRSLKQKGAL
ncbi:MAG: hypothetical protein SF187_14220 [Deltaproteobacteria bacterium]|nr:hypothetical protein [Deltaproteobacteria bacterium]